MEKRYSDVIGMPVIAQSDSGLVGRVKHVLLDTESGKIVAFLLKFFGDQAVISQDIVKLTNVIVVPSTDDLIDFNEVERIKELREKGEYLLTKRVETESGMYVGRVYDYAFDSKVFELRKIYVRKAFLGLFFAQKFLVGVKSIIEIRKDKVIVEDAVRKNVSFRLKENLSADFS